NGIVVLRYDERGVGGSEGDFTKATTQEFNEDAAAAIDHLKIYSFVDQEKIGLIGHSEGGMIGWMLGAENKNLNFVVVLAGPVVPINELMAQQTKDVLTSGGADREAMEKQLTINKKVYQVVKE